MVDDLADVVRNTDAAEWRRQAAVRDQAWAVLRDLYAKLAAAGAAGPGSASWDEAASLCIQAVLLELQWRERQATEEPTPP